MLAGKKAPSPKDVSKAKSLEGKAKFARYEYLLELSAANAQYRKFRDEQIPEVYDVRGGGSLDACGGVGMLEQC